MADGGAKTEPPVAHMPLNPVFASHARLFIGIINSSKPVYGMKNIFSHPSGIQISRVEVFAFVTEKIDKFDCLKLTLNDGTGGIRCIINKRSRSATWARPGLSVSEITGKLLEQQRKSDKNLFYSQRFANHKNLIELGDFVVVQAKVIISRWCPTPQLVAMKLQVVEEPILKKWAAWTEKAIFLNEKFYAKTAISVVREKLLTS